MRYVGWLCIWVAMAGMPTAAEIVDDHRLPALKRDSRVFERIMVEVLRQHFENPFAVASPPQATFVPAHGIVVSFHLKINRGTIRGLYGEVTNPVKSDRRTKREKLDTVREMVIQVLADYGSTLKNLEPDETVTICAHVEDRNELDPLESRTDIVVSSQKGNIDRYITRGITLEDFQRELSILEY